MLDDVETQPARPSGVAADLGRTLGRYVVLEVLGRGGMGVVYAAYDPVLDRKIALKLLSDPDDDGSSGRARMRREAQALAKLSHPNVCVVHDVDDHEKGIYIAMELVQGTTLRVWEKGRPWREVLAGYLDAARGLQAAHEAGIIHRDFKPDNVLVGHDGRVRVTDFGLARLAPEADGIPVLGELSSNLTLEGMVMGTPSYMAPEQIDGLPVDARSDQFTWCLSAWEALFGEPPWPLGSLAIRSAAIKTDLPKPPPKTRVPRAVTRVLLRGLAPDPEKRWPDMAALVGAMERARASRRVIIGVAAAGAAAVLAAVFVIARQAPEGSHCDRAGVAIDGAWNPTAVHAAFAATHAPFADAAFAAVDRGVDAWRERWRDVALDSCRATRERSTQSEAMLDLRTACLSRARGKLVAFGDALAKADVALVERAPQMTMQLPDLAACDASVVGGVVPAPRDPASVQLRQKIEHALDELERDTLHGMSLDDTKTRLATAQIWEAAATTFGWPPLEARARRDVAMLQEDLGRGKDARTTLLAAAAAAQAANDPDALLALELDLLDLEGRITSDWALAESWATLAGGTLVRLGDRPAERTELARRRGHALERAGHPDDARRVLVAALPFAKTPLAQVGLLSQLGLAENDLGDLADARAHLEHARELAKQELGPAHPRVAQLAHDLGTTAYRQGRYAEAEALFREALAGREAARGADSTEAAESAEALGTTLLAEDRLGDAQPLLERAIKTLEARLGPTNSDVLNAYNDIGGAYHRAGRYAEALANGEHVLAIREQTLGPDHPDVAESLVNTAIESKALGKWDRVFANYARAIAIFDKAYGPGSIESGIARLNLAEAQRVHGDLDAAGATYEKSRAILAAKLGEEHPVLAHIWNGIGQLELARGHAAAALPLLERAVAMREKDGDAPDLAESRFALARALVAIGGDKVRATQLATQARDAYRTSGPGFAKQAAEIDAWLK
ncbi:MAG TPA: serine/threonine-protein kinase [Kofleriaceae bacterium]|nr:serine/threonine-protein kinase [Kofleriaceae bacterium]